MPSSNTLKPYTEECIIDPDNRPTAILRQSPNDFQVIENLNWTFSGTGEHLFLEIEKTNQNTTWVAKQLAQFYQVPLKDIGYAGLKDRRAVTTQFFSIRLPKKDKTQIPVDLGFTVLQRHIHHKKLKRGFHQSNQFIITLRDVDIDPEILAAKVKLIKQQGMPNFFDQQRFGHQSQNIARLTAWAIGEIKVKKRNEISILLSTLRACIFNEILSTRIKDKTWNQIISGDTMQLNGSHSHFLATDNDPNLATRLAELDIHPTGLLIGENYAYGETTCQQLEYNIFNKYSKIFMPIIKRQRLEQARRPLRVKVENLNYQLKDHRLIFQFNLPTGSYATALIKQFVNPIEATN